MGAMLNDAGLITIDDSLACGHVKATQTGKLSTPIRCGLLHYLATDIMSADADIVIIGLYEQSFPPLQALQAS